MGWAKAARSRSRRSMKGGCMTRSPQWRQAISEAGKWGHPAPEEGVEVGGSFFMPPCVRHRNGGGIADVGDPVKVVKLDGFFRASQRGGRVDPVGKTA